MSDTQLVWGLAESGCLRAAVIGAGSMGAGIAAQFANAGVQVDLLDMTTDRAEAGIAAQLKAGGFMGAEAAGRVRPGNTETDLARLADADWIIEAVIEDLAIKRALYARITPHLKAGAVVSSNTSTIPRAALVEGQTAAFADAFVISHFFNPPRHMPLLEIVAPEGSAAARFAAQAGRVALGKTVIDCRDTPGFIANRIGCAWMSVAMVQAARLGLGVEMADAVHTAFGIPKTGVFGLIDLVGIDIVPHVWGSLMRALPGDDTINRFDLPGLPAMQALIAAGHFGRKSGAGFYRKGAAGPEVFDLARLTYTPATGFAPSDLPGGGRDLPALLADDGMAGAYARAVLSAVMAYAQTHAPAIAPSPQAVDTAMELGYAWRTGPFRLLAGLDAASRERLGGLAAPALQRDGAGADRLTRAKTGAPIAANGAAALWDIGGGLGCLEIQTKMNAIDAGVLDMIETALDRAVGQFSGLVIGNHNARAFSAGANLSTMAAMIEAAHWAGIESFIARGQAVYAALRAAPVPVVAAMRGVALGGGCELAMHCTATLAHAEAKVALPEHMVGLLPAWGGSTRLLARSGAQGAFAAAMLTRPPGSAREAGALGLLDPAQPIAMHADDVLDAAAALAERLVPGHAAPAPAALVAAGPDAAQALLAPLTLSDADRLIAKQIAFVLTGGQATAGSPLTEDDLRALEREGFLALARLPMTLDRIRHMLKTGKPLKT